MTRQEQTWLGLQVLTNGKLRGSTRRRGDLKAGHAGAVADAMCGLKWFLGGKDATEVQKLAEASQPAQGGTVITSTDGHLLTDHLTDRARFSATHALNFHSTKYP